MKRILKNKRRGFILATCFGAMSMVMMISTLLVLMMRTDIAKQRVEDRTTVMYSTLDEIGAKFVAGGGSFSTDDLSENQYKGTTYYCLINPSTDDDGKPLYNLSVKSSENGPVLLEIVLDENNNVIKWTKNY